MDQSLRDNLWSGIRWGLFAGVGTLVVLAIVYLIARGSDVPFSTLSRDASATFEAPWYVGSLSNLGVMILTAGAAVALFTASLPLSRGNPEIRGLLGALGVLVAVVAIDDLLLLHEEIMPEYVGIPSPVVMAVYGVALLAILIRFRSSILHETAYGILVLSGLLLALSIAVDVIGEEELFELPFPGFVVEDPAKLAGFVLIAGYLVKVSRDVVSGLFAGASAQAETSRQELDSRANPRVP